MDPLLGMMDGDSPRPNYIDEDAESITAEERERRAKLDELIDKVHRNHSTVKWNPGTDPSVDITRERQRLFEQCRRLPGEPKLKLRNRAGEMMVTFYNHVLHKPSESDEDDGDEDESETDSYDENYKQDKRSTCRPVPLQYLYEIKGDGLEMVPRKSLLRFLPGNLEDAAGMSGPAKRPKNPGGNLRIIEFPTPICADDFAKKMKGKSLEELISDPKAGITKIKYDKHSAFLTGVAHYQNLPRVAFCTGTLSVVAIPYLGQEPKSSASFRKEPPIPIPTTNNSPRLEKMAEKLTAYPIADGDNIHSFSNSSLSLFQYKFPLQSDTKLFDKWQTVLDADEWHTMGDSKTERELIVVHQALFMVLDNATIAAFRAPNDIRPEYAALFPSDCDSVGAYHALINIINNLLRSSDVLIPQKFRQIVSELELLVQARYDGLGRGPPAEGLTDEDLTLKLRTVETELSAMVNVVETQIDVLRSLRKLRLRIGTEQWKIMGHAIDMAVGGRESLRKNIKGILKDLQASQQLLRYLLIKAARTQAEDIGSQLIIVAETAKKSAEEASKCVEGVTEVAKQAKEASEKNAKQWKRQGAKITALTVILTVFAPLNFMTSYRGMNLNNIKNTTWKQARFWMLSLLLTTGLSLFVISVGFRREWARRAKFFKWIFSRLSHRRFGRVSLAGTPHSIGSSDTSSSVSEHKVDLSDPWNHYLDAGRGHEGAWEKFWAKPLDGDSFWDYK